MTITTERAQEIIAGCEGVTPGPWECEDVENRQDNDPPRFTSYEVVGQTTSVSRHSICDTLNSGSMAITVESDEDGYSAWDEQGRLDMAHIARLDPATIRDAFTELLTLRQRESDYKAAIQGAVEALGALLLADEETEKILWGALPDSAIGTLSIALRDFRRAREALSNLKGLVE